MKEPMADTSYEDYGVSELIEEMRRVAVGDARYGELRAELERRLMERQLEVCDEQVKSAWLQTAAVFLMFLTVIATVVAPIIAKRSTKHWVTRRRIK